MNRASTCIGLAIALTQIVGCGAADSTGILAELVSIEDVVDWGRDITLEENPRVINVSPIVSFDPRGGMLIVDSKEAQLRRYGVNGELLWAAGRKGGGPGEFNAPNRSLRLGTGEILVADYSKKFVVFDSIAGEVTRTIDTPFRRIEHLLIVNDSILLVAAMLNGDFNSPLLHLWNYRSNEVLKSFGLAPFESGNNQTAAVIASWSRISTRGDTLAAIFSLRDSVYFYTLDGEYLDTKWLPSNKFRQAPDDGPVGSDVDQAKWLGTFDFMYNIHWLEEGDLLVTYMTVIPERALEREFHLVRMRRDGAGVFEIRNSPKLLALDTSSRQMLFEAPESEAPNQWRTAYLR